MRRKQLGDHVDSSTTEKYQIPSQNKKCGFQDLKKKSDNKQEILIVKNIYTKPYLFLT